MSVRISPNLPANVVEIGNEITQAKINEINSGTLALQTWVSGQGYIAENVQITTDQLAAINYASNAPSSANPFATNSFVTGQGYITTSYTYDTKKAIANLCASCFGSAGSTFYFTNYVAQCVQQGSKFTSGSAFLLGLGYFSSAPIYTFTLIGSGPAIADTGVSYTSVGGMNVCYSEDSGSTWTYSDLSF